ncbi:hypothetical protein OII53_16415 [Achromobacter ruhlandii]|uniref:hypothetical protein n=1 Tax=Achromobacter ruhlandii TaxID=72557 RepID=UPI0021F0E016|nr:hypothetical protein [Achromobacter ruhlandii]MCV6796247.1 hypothetical protein [Achromobacter ruhlandii]MCV6804048.1 hypothetical protein [Achromobacter ruhlandii]MCV6810993.1 hypothetical protein [Achromobacter ruhlandii]MCV6820129.1 hypothetical protein [Achromobacter ruhlandii]
MNPDRGFARLRRISGYVGPVYRSAHRDADCRVAPRCAALRRVVVGRCPAMVQIGPTNGRNGAHRMAFLMDVNATGLAARRS